MKYFHLGMTSLRVRPLGPINIALVAGVVTVDAVRAIIPQTDEWRDHGKALVNVIHYDASVVAIRSEQLLPLVHAGRYSGIHMTPTAIVVSRDQLDLFTKYVHAAMSIGTLKAVFIEAEKARDWAARQAAIRERWIELKRRARSNAAVSEKHGS